jgi:hypothetical protein
VQIFKIYKKFKIQIKFERVLLLELGPAPVFGLAVAHFLFSFPNRPLSLSPLGLGLTAGPARPLGPADRASVVPCPIAASLMGKRLTLRRLCPSPFPADRWAPPVITFLWLCLSSTSRRRLVEPRWLPCPLLFMADRYHSLISDIITIYSLYSPPPLVIPAAGRYRVHRLGAPSSSPINWPPRPRRSPHLPHLTVPLF